MVPGYFANADPTVVAPVVAPVVVAMVMARVVARKLALIRDMARWVEAEVAEVPCLVQSHVATLVAADNRAVAESIPEVGVQVHAAVNGSGGERALSACSACLWLAWALL